MASVAGKRIGALTDHEVPDILLKTLTKIASREPPKDPAVLEEIIILFHAVFSKMGTKGKALCLSELFLSISFHFLVFTRGNYSTKLFCKLPSNKKDTLQIYNNNKRKKENCFHITVSYIPAYLFVSFTA